MICLIAAMLNTCLFTLTGQTLSRYGSEMLTSTEFTDICMDSNGYIWIGTEYGLNQFDGISFRHYVSEDSNNDGLCGNHILRTHIAPDSTFWVLTTEGLHYHDLGNGTFQKLQITDSSKPQLIYSDLCNLTDSSLLILTSFGIFEVNIHNHKATPYHSISIPTDSPRAIVVDRKRRLFISDDRYGLSAYDLDKSKNIGRRDAPIFDNNKYVISLRTDNNGRALVSSPEGVYRFDDDSLKFIPISKLPTHTTFASGDELYLATYDYGVKALNPEQNPRFRNLPEAITHGHADAVLIDRYGNLTVCIQQDAVYSYTPESITCAYIPAADFSKAGTPLYSLNSSHDGNIWVGQDKNGTTLIKPDKTEISHICPGTTPTCVTETSNGDIFIGLTYGGIYHKTTADTQPEHLDLGRFDKGFVKTIVQMSDTTLLVAFLDKGIIMIDNNGFIKNDNLVPAEMMRNSTINTMIIDKSQRLWIGTNSGAECYDLNSGELMRLPQNDVFHTASTYMIAPSYPDSTHSRATLWFATNKGLFKLDCNHDSIIGYSTGNGLPDNNICAVIPIADSSLWLSTFKGISHFNPKSGKIVNYSENRNLLARKYNRGLGGLTTDSLIYFGTDNGFVLFSPKKVESLPHTVPHSKDAETVASNRKGIYILITASLLILILCGFIAKYVLSLKHKLNTLQNDRNLIGRRRESIDSPIQNMTDSDKDFIAKVEAIVKQHLSDENLGVEMIASETGYSRAQLHRRIKEITGDSPGNLIRRIRMDHAAEMLLDRSCTVSQIAYTIGFSAPPLFSSAFKRYFGMTPSEYRDQNSNSKNYPDSQ